MIARTLVRALVLGSAMLLDATDLPMPLARTAPPQAIGAPMDAVRRDPPAIRNPSRRAPLVFLVSYTIGRDIPPYRTLTAAFH